MHLILADTCPELIAELRIAFANVPNVEIICADITQACAALGSQPKAVINPGQSHGMSDGIDGTICRLISSPWNDISKKLQDSIDQIYMGQQPVGSALLIETANSNVSYMVHAPTMLIPGSVKKTYNAYTAFRAALLEIWRHNCEKPELQIRTIICPGLATGIGMMSPATSAKQMRLAWDSLVQPIPHHWPAIWSHHRKLDRTFRKD